MRGKQKKLQVFEKRCLAGQFKPGKKEQEEIEEKLGRKQQSED